MLRPSLLLALVTTLTACRAAPESTLAPVPVLSAEQADEYKLDPKF